MPKIIVYSTPGCPYCIRLKDYLKQKGLDFTGIDVSVNQAELDKMVSISGQMGVPVIDVDGKILVGFDKEKIEKLLV